MDGAHDINTCYRVTLRTLRVVFRELEDAGVVLDGILLKPNMVIDGAKCPTKVVSHDPLHARPEACKFTAILRCPQASADQIAELTIKCFLETVPAKVRLPLPMPGLTSVYLSGCVPLHFNGERVTGTSRGRLLFLMMQVPGIVFLSGGQSEEQATLNLSRMNQLGPLPWPLGFSYGRALQASTLKVVKQTTTSVH